MRGRKPKPDAIKRLSGNPGRRKRKGKAFDPPAAAEQMVCPTWLDDRAKEFWKELAPQLGMIITPIDQGKFAVFCQALADVQRNVETIRKNKTGEDIETPNGTLMSHPAVARKNRAMLIVAKLGSDFGLDPASRARLTVPDKQKDEPEKEDFFDGPRLAAG